MLFETRARLLGRHHVEELLLSGGGAHPRHQVGLIRLWLARLAHFILLMAKVSLAPPSRRHNPRCRPAPGSIRRNAPATTAADISLPAAPHCRRCAALARFRRARRWMKFCASASASRPVRSL